ncbi:MAG: iron ABC transporter permease [Coriobacteriales bacterium]|jgi:iron complex transport system permease protein|nr:iron ABC transporter permease [Coriobacteriales bacterium]
MSEGRTAGDTGRDIGRRRRFRRFLLVAGALLVVLLGAVTLSMTVGTFGMTLPDLLGTLAGTGSRQQEIALYTIRVPRILIALLVGGALAVSGAILQSVTRNDLADPGILGISSGAALFVVVYIYLTNGGNYYSVPTLTIFTMPLIALAGGLVAALLIYTLAWRRGMKPTRLLLMGIAVNAAFAALIVMLQISFDVKDFNRVLMWTMGSIWGANQSYVLAVGPALLLLVGLAIYQSRYLDVYTLGDETAEELGVNVERRRRGLIAIAAGLAALATAVAGSIAFVGLVAPHIARRLVGPQHRYLLPVSLFVGMVLVVTGDIIVRNLFAPIEIHLGIVISLIGVPYFMYLLLKR